ncbi:MAG: hypothetical protein AAFY11_08385, partial [Cyanobacteria bacterium J06641_5]
MRFAKAPTNGSFFLSKIPIGLPDIDRNKAPLHDCSEALDRALAGNINTTSGLDLACRCSGCELVEVTHQSAGVV